MLISTVCLVASCSKPPEETSQQPISDLTYAEIHKQTPNMYTDARLEAYSDELRGTRVRWTGEAHEVDGDHVVHVAMDDHRTPNVEFALDEGSLSRIKPGETITFVGTIQKITSIQTYPPMPNMHVYLEAVQLETP